MCGIYGFTGIADHKTKNIIYCLGILNESRGKDSTGMAIITNNKIEILKKAVNATVFFNDLQKQNHIVNYNDLQYLTILGHTRQATTGDVKDDNAHPFKIDNYIFTHNGVINNFDSLQETYKTKYAVDSQIIGHLLSIKKHKQNAFKKLSGFFTVPFVNLKEKEMLQVAIHSAAFAFAYKENQLYYSSDIKHLKTALQGQGFTICQGGDNLLYKFYLAGNGIAISKEKIRAMRTHYNSYYNWELDAYYNKPSYQLPEKAGQTKTFKKWEEFIWGDL